MEDNKLYVEALLKGKEVRNMKSEIVEIFKNHLENVNDIELLKAVKQYMLKGEVK
ncbi:hypothetical protein [Virgibacillus siamensis]|uniref:hypothetical protein n=1 Tax=Virgibacillus siamensis TaxID=480071 RepID=UPI00158CAC0C|nr:hypothetical protein [Virgibacillus siamensis]